MRIPERPHSHLTYCSNIHPGESWHDHFANLQRHLPQIKKQVCADDRFGLGLRLSALAANELIEDQVQFQQFIAWLKQENLYVFTINGFPFGTFHSEKIKEKVYLPDWSSPERLDYTKNLAKILADLLDVDDEDLNVGSISTVPLGFKSNFIDEQKISLAHGFLIDWLIFAHELEQKTGKCIKLALEPEPACFLECTEDVLQFFERRIFSEKSLGMLAKKGLEESACDFETIQRYLGVCVDTCHAAVMFESAVAMCEALQSAKIAIHKIQLTTALQASLDSKNLKVFEKYADNIYLHQSTLVDESGDIHFYLDLPEALKAATAFSASKAQFRSHFHVPVFVEQLETLRTTQNELIEFLQYLKLNWVCPHLEVETYTFDLLPKELVEPNIERAIARELNWVKERVV